MSVSRSRHAPVRRSPLRRSVRLDALEEVIALLRRLYGAQIIRRASDIAALPAGAGMPSLSTGSLALDLATGGLPRGALSEMAGPEGAGTGTLACAALAHCQRVGGLALLVDADQAADPDALLAVGVDLESLVLACPASAREAWDVLRTLSLCGALDLLVLCSLSGALSLPDAGWGVGYLERRLVRLTAVLRGRRTAVLVTNQSLPAPPGRGSDPLTDGRVETVGGRPVAQAASLRIALRPRGVRYTAYGDVAALCSDAWVAKYYGHSLGAVFPLAWIIHDG